VIDKAFPNEAELNILSSGVKKRVGRAEILANDNKFLEMFLKFIKATNNLKMFLMPDDLRDSV
jgi:hypothetical protein